MPVSVYNIEVRITHDEEVTKPAASVQEASTLDDGFTEAIEVILSYEGGYAFDPNDLGGETKYGISKRAYPHLNIRTLTRADAISIYQTDYWNRNKIFNFPAKTRLELFDMAVNMGTLGMAKVLQRALNHFGYGLTVDGAIGAKTLKALNEVSENISYFIALERIIYYNNLVISRPNQLTFLKGWLNRAMGILTKTI